MSNVTNINVFLAEYDISPKIIRQNSLNGPLSTALILLLYVWFRVHSPPPHVHEAFYCEKQEATKSSFVLDAHLAINKCLAWLFQTYIRLFLTNLCHLHNDFEFLICILLINVV